MLGLSPHETVTCLCLTVLLVLRDVVDFATCLTVLEVGEQDQEDLVDGVGR